MKFSYKVNTKTETELCQTESSSTISGVPTLSIKKKECIEDGKIGSYPYYSGNSWRNILRREIASYITKKIGCNLKPTDFHLNFAGGGSNYQLQPIEVVKKIRELNPIASMFGASLAIEGKLMVSNLEPQNKFWKETKEGYRYSALKGVVTYTKKDDLLVTGSVSPYVGFVDAEDREEYLEINADIQEARANARQKEDGDAEKIKKANIQSFNKAECIIIGANLTTYLGAKEELTPVEYGMMLKGLELMTKQQLGGLKNKGYGVVSYSITKEDESSSRTVIESSKNEENIYNPNTETFYSNEEKEAIKAFEDWLENATAENLEISKILV